MTPSKSSSCPTRNVTGSTSPSCGDIGCSSERTAVTTTCSGGPSRASSGCASRRSTIRRVPTVSTPGESRSCGRVSQDGNVATASPKTPLQLGGQVVGFAPGRGDHQQRTLPRQRAGHEQACAGRPDQAQFGRPIGRALDELLEGGRRQRQFDEPRDRGIWAASPRCGHDAPILRAFGRPVGSCALRTRCVKIAPAAVKGS